MSTVFFSYSHKDENLRDPLETHLAMLKRQGVISAWHDRRLLAGSEVDVGISEALEGADIILLLVSPDFLASDYCYGREMTRALEREAAGNARVIPVILRPCEWEQAPFRNLLAAPKDGKPVTKWPDPDDAFLDITRAIRAVVKENPPLSETRGSPPATPEGSTSTTLSGSGPRSSNLRIRKSFTEEDRDRFLDDAFKFMGRFFENSLHELEERNPGIKARFRRVDANRFTSALYRDGKALARCQIRLGGIFDTGISFSLSDNPSDNSSNENLSVEVGEQALNLKPLGMAMYGAQVGSHLSFEGAAEYYWSLFIRPLQQ